MKKILLLLVMVILLLNITMAAPPQISPDEISLTIIYPKNTYFVFGSDLQFFFLVFNSTGQIMGDYNTDCNLHVFNSTGNHVIEIINLSYNTSSRDFLYEAAYTLFPTPGQYGFLVDCNSTIGQGGFVSDSFNIQRAAPVGEGLEGFHVAVVLSQLGVLVFLIVLGLKLDEEHYPLKLFFIWLSSIMLMPFVNTIYQLAEDISLSSGLVTMMETTYYISWAIMSITTFYFGVQVFKNILLWFGDSINVGAPKERRKDKL